MEMREVSSGRSEISKFIASDGIYYKEGDKYEFAGSELVYDISSDSIKVRGDAGRPCLFNGVFVDAIEYDMATGKVATQLAGAGVLLNKAGR